MIAMLTSRLLSSPGAERRPSTAAVAGIVDATSKLSHWLQQLCRTCSSPRRPHRRPRLQHLMATHTIVRSVPYSHGFRPRPSGAAMCTIWVAPAYSVLLHCFPRCSCRQQIHTIVRRATPTGRPVGLSPRRVGAAAFMARVEQAPVARGALHRLPSTARRASQIGSRVGPSRRRIGVARTKVKGARVGAKTASGFFNVQILPKFRVFGQVEALLDSLRGYHDLFPSFEQKRQFLPVVQWRGHSQRIAPDIVLICIWQNMFGWRASKVRLNFFTATQSRQFIFAERWGAMLCIAPHQ